MKHLKGNFKDTFTLQGCRNVNLELANELIAIVQKGTVISHHTGHNNQQ
jgi:hypothetical protein